MAVVWPPTVSRSGVYGWPPAIVLGVDSRVFVFISPTGAAEAMAGAVIEVEAEAKVKAEVKVGSDGVGGSAGG